MFIIIIIIIIIYIYNNINNNIINKSNKITMADFKKALAYVEPSLKREQSLKIENLTWDDVGGLEDVKKV